MARWLAPLLAIVVIPWWSASIAHADLATFWPQPNIDIRVLIENLDEYPDFDFYLKYGIGRGNPSASARSTKIESRVLTKLEGSGTRFTGAFLAAVPHGTPKPERSTDSNAQRGRAGDDWLGGAPVGGLQSRLLISHNDNNCELTFRVKIEDGVLRAELLESKNPGQRMLLMIGGGVLSAVAVFVGMILFRERRLRLPTPPAKETPNPR